MSATLFLFLSGVIEAQTVSDPILDDLVRGARFRNVGPAGMGGRISDVESLATHPLLVYVGVASGGVWKTSDGGTTWLPVFDSAEVASIGDIAIAPSRPDVVWVGTGEANLRESTGWGNGVYKSSDGGRSWEHLGLAGSKHIGRIIAHPTDADVAYVAAVGDPYGPSKDRGVFKTTDGGKTWTPSLVIDDGTGAVDLAVDPTNPAILYAAAYQPGMALKPFRSRTGSRSGIYKTTDGGAKWTRLAGSLPDGDLGRIGLAISTRDPRVVYATIDSREGGVFRSDDGGTRWERRSPLNVRPTYYSQIRVDPTNSDRVWVLSADPLFYSEDGGRTFCASEDNRGDSYCSHWLERLHFDSHALWINPSDPEHMILGGDGGVYISRSRGRTWDYVQTLSIAQFYQIGYDMQEPYYVYGGMQDTGTWMGPSRSPYMMGITNNEWFGVLVGDGYYVTVDPTDADTIYAEYQGGRVFRIRRRSWERRDITPLAPAGAKRYRIGHNHPLLMSPHDPKRIYLGGDRLFTSSDRGERWTESKELTREDGEIYSIAESPTRPGVIWVGTTDGLVQVSQDSGTTWTDVTPAIGGAPPAGCVTRVIASRSSEGAAYAAFDAHHAGDYRPHLYKTTDFGRSWTSFAGSLPEQAVIKVVREHPRNANLLFAGTERGLFVSFDAGRAWRPLHGDLPAARIADLQIHQRENDLLVGTHGRGIFILDDLTPFEQLSDRGLASDLHLFDLRPATMHRLFNQNTNTGPGHRIFIAGNPEYGAPISYALRSRPSDGVVRISITDANGGFVREIEAPGRPGVNRISWDLRHASPFQPPKGLRPDPPGQPGGPRMRMLTLSQGPLVYPGDYTVKLSADGAQVTKTLQVREDPRIEVSEQDLYRHREAWHRVSRLYAGGNRMFQRIRGLRSQLNEARERLARGSSSLGAAIAGVEERLAELQPLVGNSGRESGRLAEYIDPTTGFGEGLTNLAGQLVLTFGNFTGAPTPRHAQLIDELTIEFETRRTELNTVIERLVPQLNAGLRQLGVPPIDPGPSIPGLQEQTRAQPR